MFAKNDVPLPTERVLLRQFTPPPDDGSKWEPPPAPPPEVSDATPRPGTSGVSKPKPTGAGEVVLPAQS